MVMLSFLQERTQTWVIIFLTVFDIDGLFGMSDSLSFDHVDKHIFSRPQTGSTISVVLIQDHRFWYSLTTQYGVDFRQDI